tara:strand:- start:2439 stop:2597 length:159 start_codon:yes stop_codon:yes gene_type:complete
MSNTVSINPDKVYTKSEYSKVFKISRPTIDKRIVTKELTSMKIKGAVLILDK